jgi:hypothetical protein
MPHDRIAAVSGVGHAASIRGSAFEHNPHHTAHGKPLTEEEFREFLREEQAEGGHPILQGRRF